MHLECGYRENTEIFQDQKRLAQETEGAFKLLEGIVHMLQEEADVK